MYYLSVKLNFTCLFGRGNILLFFNVLRLFYFSGASTLIRIIMFGSNFYYLNLRVNLRKILESDRQPQ